MILRLCRPEDTELTLLGGEYDEFLGQKFFNIVPVALIAESSSQFNALEKFALTRYSFIMYQSYNFVRFVCKAHRFIMVASSQPLLRSVLQVRDKSVKRSNARFCQFAGIVFLIVIDYRLLYNSNRVTLLRERRTRRGPIRTDFTS